MDIILIAVFQRGLKIICPFKVIQNKFFLKEGYFIFNSNVYQNIFYLFAILIAPPLNGVNNPSCVIIHACYEGACVGI